MARTRLLHPAFFRHEGLAELPRDARLLFAGLWTVVDREGRAEDRPRRIKADLFPYDDGLDIDALLDQLSAAGFIVRYTAGDQALLAIPSFTRWQKPHPRESPSEFAGPEKGTPRFAQGTPRKPVSISVSVSNPVSVSDSDSTTFAQSAAAQPPAPASVTPLGSYLERTWPGKWPGKFGDLAKLEAAWAEACPGVDLLAEAKKARAWEVSNPQKRRPNTRRFLGNWFKSAQEDAGKNGRALPLSAREAPTDAETEFRSWFHTLSKEDGRRYWDERADLLKRECGNGPAEVGRVNAEIDHLNARWREYAKGRATA